MTKEDTTKCSLKPPLPTPYQLHSAKRIDGMVAIKWQTSPGAYALFAVVFGGERYFEQKIRRPLESKWRGRKYFFELQKRSISFSAHTHTNTHTYVYIYAPTLSFPLHYTITAFGLRQTTTTPEAKRLRQLSKLINESLSLAGVGRQDALFFKNAQNGSGKI